jgi:hypothetical protein
MAGIRGGHAGQHHEAARHQPVKRGTFKPRLQKARHGHGGGQAGEQGGLARGQPLARGHGDGKTAVVLARGKGGQGAVKGRMNHRTMVHG